LTDKARAIGTGKNRESREGNREQGSGRYKIKEERRKYGTVSKRVGGGIYQHIVIGAAAAPLLKRR